MTHERRIEVYTQKALVTVKIPLSNGPNRSAQFIGFM